MHKLSRLIVIIYVPIFAWAGSAWSKGQEIDICENQTVPTGYVVIRKEISVNNCGFWRSGIDSWKPYSAMRVKLLGEDDRLVTICPEQNIPLGYRIVRADITSCDCGSWLKYPQFNGWEKFRCLEIERTGSVNNSSSFDLVNPDIYTLGYSGGHKTRFCLSKGYFGGYMPSTNRCYTSTDGSCAIKPIESLGYGGGHKTNYCKKNGYDGYQPGGRPGYCYKGQCNGRYLGGR